MAPECDAAFAADSTSFLHPSSVTKRGSVLRQTEPLLVSTRPARHSEDQFACSDNSWAIPTCEAHEPAVLSSPVTANGRKCAGVPDVNEAATPSYVLSAPDIQSNEELLPVVPWAKKARRIVLFIEPSPFKHVCGYMVRFQNFIRYLREMGDEVLVITTHEGAPKEFCGAKVIGSWSFPFPWYPSLSLSLGLSPRILRAVADFQPDLIHATSPGIMCFGALFTAKVLSIPLVFSYHTHVPVYIPKYTSSLLVGPMWVIIRFLHRSADLTLVVSHVLGKELAAYGAALRERILVWRKGVDSDSFHPRFKCTKTRAKLSDGEPEKPLIVHVGRLAAEKNLELLKPIMARLPGARLAFVGDGPHRAELERIFHGTQTVFTGMLQGDELAAAYASGDIFITPSESETLGFVVLEAMASGVPVVAARAGGFPDIISQDGVTGFLFKPGNVEDASAKVRKLIESPGLREEVGKAGRRDVEKFDWRASTRQVREEAYSAAVRLFLAKKQGRRQWWLWDAIKTRVANAVMYGRWLH